MNDKYISVSKFKQSLAKLTVVGGDKEYVEAIARTLSEVVPYLLDDSPAADVQPVKHSRWIPMNDGTYNAYCENCGHERGSKAWNKADYKYCPYCGTRMDLDSVTHDRCINYMDCDGNCFIDDTPCDCDGDIEKCKGRCKNDL